MKLLNYPNTFWCLAEQAKYLHRQRRILTIRRITREIEAHGSISIRSELTISQLRELGKYFKTTYNSGIVKLEKR